MIFFTLEQKIPPKILSFVLLICIFPLTHIGLFSKAFWGIDLTFIVQSGKYLGIFFLGIIFVSQAYLNKWYRSRYLLIFLFLVFNIFIVILYHSFKLKSLNSDTIINIKVITSMVSYFLIGLYYSKDFFRKYKNMLLSLFIMMAILVFSRANYDVFRLNRSLLVHKEMWGTYLQWADLFALFSFVLLGLYEKYLVKVLIIGISILSLFILNSRAALYSFTIVTITWLIISGGKKAIMLSAGVVVSFLLALFVLNLNPRMLEREGRGGNLFKGNSMNARTIMLNAGIDDIKRNPLFGNFLGQYKVAPYNNFGAYIHNYLSFWRQFGLLGFALVGLMFWWVTRFFILTRSEGSLLPFVMMTLVLSFFFRSYLYPYFWLSYGAFCSHQLSFFKSEIAGGNGKSQKESNK